MSKSLDFQQKAKTLIPGMAQLLSKRPDMFSMGVWPGYYKKAKGCRVWDLDDNEYIDMSISGIGANVLGYADDDVDAAVLQAVRHGVSSSLNCTEEVELAELLCELHPWADMARYTRGGGETVAMAVRIARAHTKRSKVAFCGYHGWHDWYLSANISNDAALDGHLLPGLDPTGVPRELGGTAIPFTFNDVEGLHKIAKDNADSLAAIVMEPIRYSGPTPEFLTAIDEIRDKYGVVLIVDEISAGFRLTTGGAHLTLGFEPDMATFSKALGNGYAMSALIGRRAVMESSQSSFISSTNWTERIGPTAALATLKKHRANNVADHLISLGTSIQKGWQAVADKHGIPITVRGIKPMSSFGFELSEPLVAKSYFIQLMLDQGFLASNIYFAMYAHSQEHVSAYLEACDVAFAKIAETEAAGTMRELLRGEPSGAGFKRLN